MSTDNSAAANSAERSTALRRLLSGSQVGGPAPDFDLPDLDGRRHRRQDYAGRWLLQVFHRHLG